MTTETHTVAMTDPQLNNNNNNNNNNNHNNNNNDGEPKYLHKKFKKMATTEAASAESKREVAVAKPRIPEVVVPREEPKEPKEPPKPETSPEPEAGEVNEGRKIGYVCPYCKLSCAKPSVLQKHIRAHTNERPYPCVPCGFAFKTRSNLYKHCRSRAHALKMEGGDSSKVSEDSDISLSDSASNGTGTPPPPPTSTPSSISSVKTVKTGKIYKPKFHTALNSVNHDVESSSVSSNSSTSSTSTPKPNAEQLQEHIDKIITDNQAIVDAVDPRLHKLMQRQQSLVEPNKYSELPLNLCSGEESSNHRKRAYSESFALEKDHAQQTDGSIIKDLLLKTKGPQQVDGLEGESLVCPACKISYTSVDNLETHRMYYCKGSPSPRRPDFQLDLEKKETDFDVKSDYYNALQPLPSPGPLLGNTRLVDAYVPPAKQRSESAPTTLRSLEELSKYPRPNSLQMFGGEVRILDNTGETKTMRIEPRQTNSPNEHAMNNRCSTAETSSVVVKSSLHSGGTMVHKPPGTPVVSTPSCSISLPNTPKMLAPIMPNISTPNIAPTMSCYSYLEANLNPLTSITAYNPLTLPQAGIASILHGGKVIPYVPGMPGPHTLSGVPPPSVDMPVSRTDSGYKVIPGIPGLHVVSQPLDLASPVKAQTPNVPGIPGPHSNMQMTYSLSQPLDLASPAKEFQLCFKTPSSDNLRVGLTSPKVPSLKTESPNEKNRRRPSTASSSEVARMEQSKITTLVSKCKNIESPRERREFAYDKSPRSEKSFVYPNGADTGYGKARYSPKTGFETRKRSANWTLTDLDANRSPVESLGKSSVTKFEPPPQENGRANIPDIKTKLLENYGPVNGAKIPRTDATPPPPPPPTPPIITVNLDSSRTDMPNDSSTPLPSTKTDDDNKSDAGKFAKIGDDDTGEEGNTKFLRPTSLPLKPGTFTPKRHHGITPTSNTLPLISPETPRPRKSYGQLYLNGHAYTYLGLKCSTRLFYCTLNRPQPMYVTQQHGLSMYSNWKICKEAPPDLDMAHYDSRHRPASYTIAYTKQDDIMTHSSQRPSTPASPESVSEGSDAPEKAKRVKIFDGGFESNEDYIYVRGRGRGRYVCEECGIRCKKPSMLKKHIRTHTDVRPYTCKHCTFSFKTKGNLTKHMKSKAHYKKCVELGVTPVPTLVCDENIDKDAVARLAAGGGNADDSSEEEDESDGDESEESGSEEHEAAQGLLSLSQQNSNRLPGLLPSGRPTTYPYTLTLSPTSIATTTITTVSCTAPLSSQAAAVIQSELSHRYYFPSNRCSTTEKSRGSVIQSSKKSSSDTDVEVDVEVIHESDPQCQFSQPMDLTTKQIAQPSIPSPQRLPKSVSEILTPVSEPGLLHTIVHTMERLPIQGREWKPEAQGHMLQAYLTERHVMDSKMKQQYRVGNSKLEKAGDKERYLTQQDTLRSRNLELNGVPTVTYTDPSKMHQHALIESRIKLAMKQTTIDAQMEIRDKMYHDNAERRSFEVDPIHGEDNFDRRGMGSPRVALNPASSFSIANKTGPTVEHGQFSLDLPSAGADRLSPRLLGAELINRTSSGSQMKSEIDRSSMFNAMKMMREMERPRECRSPNLDARPPSRESRLQTSRSQDPRPSGSEVRAPSQDYRSCGPELRIPRSQDLRIHVPEARPAGQEFNHQELRPQAQEVASLNVEARSTNPEARSPVRDARPMPSQEPRPGYDAAPPQQLHEIARVPEVQKPANNEVRAVADRAEMKQNNETRQSMNETIKHSVARKMVVGGPGFRSPSPPGGSPKPQAEFLQPSSGPAPNYVSVTEDGRSVCGICNKVFSKPSQLRLHINIHYFERPFRCESCAVSFRTKGHLTKHERSVSHHNKVSMTSTFGAATTSNPRPFKCTDCKIAFRIHGHLAKHLRSKMHIMKLECLGKLPFGTYAEMERSGINLNDIDTSDCDNSLTSLQNLAQKLYDKDPSKMGQWDAEMIPGQGTSGGDTSSDEGEPIPLHPLHQYSPQISLENETSRSYHMPILVSEETKPLNEIRHANPQFTPARSDFAPSDRQPTSRVPNDESMIADDTSQMYKCHICSISIRTLSELQAHRFVEHNVEADSCAVVNRNSDPSIARGGRDKERARRLNGENILRSGRKRQVVDDT